MHDPLIMPDALSCDLDALPWAPFRDGVEVSWLYRNGDHGAAAAFMRYAPGARIPLHLHAGYEHILVLRGSQTDQRGRHAAGTLIINPPGTMHDLVSDEGCVVLIFWERPVILDPDIRGA